MSEKKRLLYIGDSPTVQTGFARVTESVLDVLKDYFDVHVLGVNYYNQEHDYPYPIYPAAGKDLEHVRTAPHGGKVLLDVYKKVQPEIVLACNDIWVLNEYSNILSAYTQAGITKFFAYFPVDGGPYHKSLVTETFSWTGVATYTEFGKSVLENAGVMQNVKVIPHGTNTNDFYPMNKSKARAELGLRDDVFMVFNGNRNQPRKRYDLMVKGFAKFLKGKPKNQVGLFAHGGLRPSNGWNVPALLEREMQLNGVDTSQKVLYQFTDKPYPHNLVSKQTLNTIYNAMDVGINTCMGEGWGLVNSEHAVTGVPQIVPNHSSLAELFANERGFLIPVSYWETERPYLLERGIVSPTNVARVLNSVYENPKLAEERAQKARQYFVSNRLSWNTVAHTMKDWILSYL